VEEEEEEGKDAIASSGKRRATQRSSTA
jgi:hypothetical protein